MTMHTTTQAKHSPTSSRMVRSTRLMQSIVRSLVQTCIRTTGQAQRVATARAAAARAGAARAAVQAAVRSVTPVYSTSGRSAKASAPLRGAHAATGAESASLAASPLPTTTPAFARVSSRRGALPVTQNPVRIYSTPSRTVMVGNLSEVSRLLDLSIERERARLVPQVS
ncbi:conserved protein of unknown function [Pararobbsia alpina]|uniref:hypothetical protein n=1 Tax=Pararobbsia alpina TaxID=621374 RepID=UPI0039A785B3